MNLNLIAIISLVIGAILLISGRQLYWLLVGALGFFAGIIISNSVFPAQSGWTPLLFALVMGVIGTGLALFIQKTAIGLVGFIAGVFLVILLFNHFSFGLGIVFWVLLGIGGITGAILMRKLFDWGLIIFSSLAGTLLITNVIKLDQPLAALLFIALLLLGLIVQGRKKALE
jgi:hypothetical protein